MKSMQPKIKGILFDYGGTIDTNGIHWFEVFYQMYAQEEIISDKEILRKAYIFGEQEMERNSHLVKPAHTFKHNLQQKVRYQADYLTQRQSVNKLSQQHEKNIVENCYDFVRKNIAEQSKILEKLAERFPMIVVSNFYGNLQSVLRDFGIDHYFKTIIESAKAGIRKPSPDIFRLGVAALEMDAKHIAVIGDSYKNDMAPAKEIGCTGIWLKSIGWDDEEDRMQTADYVINDLAEVLPLFGI